MQSFWLALQFLTRLPAPRYAEVSAQAVGRSLLFYPLVGLILGALLLAVAQLVDVFPPLMTAALVLAAWLLLSGALHIDGLADMADAWVGGHGDRERTLRIMKDPYCGPMGVSAVVALLLLKFSALNVAISEAPELLLVAPLLGRSLVLLLMLTTPYCREQGLASVMVDYMPRRAIWSLLAVVVLLMFICLGWAAAVLHAVAVMLFLLYRRALMQRMQGYTGDAAGALIELAEVVILFTGIAIMSTTPQSIIHI